MFHVLSYFLNMWNFDFLDFKGIAGCFFPLWVRYFISLNNCSSAAILYVAALVESNKTGARIRCLLRVKLFPSTLWAGPEEIPDDSVTALV